MTSLKKAIAPEENPALVTVDTRDTSRWAFINGWKLAPQADDRIPMFGSVVSSEAAPSARRSIARRRHQVMFKEWSQQRHD
jgi:hypothetical protein